MKRVANNLLLKSLDQQNYGYHLVGQNLQKDSHLNLNQGEEWYKSWDHFVDGSGDTKTQTSTPKSMDKVVAKIMKANKAAELFQTMAIMNLNMGNLALEINTLRNILFMGFKEKAMLQEELDKQREFQKGYKHNVEIWRKNNAKAEQKNKVLIKKLHDENEELKGSTTRLKSQDDELQNLK